MKREIGFNGRVVGPTLFIKQIKWKW